MNLRNNPVDKRRLKVEDRQFDTSRRERALKTAKQRRGSLAYQERRQLNTTTRRAGTGGFTQGISIQQARLRDKGASVARSKSYRPEDPA
tara:strand:+ start:4307 stop:4576 length:270 start_codon:yes stop_codon:yes gene_type:complete